MKKLVVYYSYTGHTKMIAEKIARKINADIEEIKTINSYSTEYQSVVDDTEDNKQSRKMTEIKPLKVKLSDYDEIIVGSPLWWYTITPPVRTFLSKNNFSNKIVIPFVTHAGWAGSAIKEATEIATQNGAKVERAKEIQFTTNYKENKLVTLEKDINFWIESL